MDLLNTLMLVIIAIIAVVIAHGFYRKWSDSRNRVVIKLERNIPQADIDLELLPNSELPNGGARSIPRENEPVIPRRRYQLKDGRDKVRQHEVEQENVPVLMDPLEIEEAAIEHANVFVTAATAAQETAAAFADEELPPEVMTGLDGEFHDSHSDADAQMTMAPATTRAIDETGLDDEHDDDQPGPQGVGDDEDEFIAADVEPLAAGDEFDDEFPEQFDGDFEEDVSEAQSADLTASPLAAEAAVKEEPAEDEAADEELAAEADADYEDEEEYDPYEDENFYENEPALLENAYKLATSRFHRHQEPEQARIEPGFGEGQSAEVETTEEFVTTLNEDAMDDFLGQEQEEIRAWRSQSVTQQDSPPVEPLPAAQPVETQAPGQFPPLSSTASVTAPAQPAASAPRVEEEMPPAVPVQPGAAKAIASAAAPARENKPGFWQTMAGKTARSVKETTAKIAQGELFHPDISPGQMTEPAVPAGPQEVVVVNVMAKPGNYFYGDEMLPVLQHYGLRLGQMNIFHRHTEVDGTGPVMFSMANMVKPGTFALNGIENFATPGVSFFVQLPNRHGNMKAFEHMLATANGVKQALDGILKDERRSVLTRQTVEHCRQRIRDFELSLLAKK